MSAEVRFRGESGRAVDGPAMSPFDPERTLAPDYPTKPNWGYFPSRPGRKMLIRGHTSALVLRREQRKPSWPRKALALHMRTGLGPFFVLLAMAEQQGLFGKYGVDVRSVAVKGAKVPRLTADMPLGMIGEPAALLQAAEGADLCASSRLSAKSVLSGHLRCTTRHQDSGRFARQAPGCARDWRRTVDINDPCPRTVGA